MAHWILLTKVSTQQLVAGRFYYTVEILILEGQILKYSGQPKVAAKSEGQMRFYRNLKTKPLKLNCLSELC